MNESDTEMVESVARAALENFAHAVIATSAPFSTEPFGFDKAHDGAIELSAKARAALGHDLSGAIVQDLDAKGLKIGDVTVRTDLAAFAQGKAGSPIESVSAESVKKLQLPSIDTKFGSVETTCTLTLDLTYRRAGSGQQPVSTTTRIALEIEYASPQNGDPK